MISIDPAREGVMMEARGGEVEGELERQASKQRRRPLRLHTPPE